MSISIPNAEEIAIKLNIDISDAKKMQDALRHAGGEAHKSFLHGDSAAKGFKKTLHELSDQIPILGYGLRALISPMGAAFAALAAGVGLAAKALEDYNTKLDAMAAKNATPINSVAPSKWRGIYRVREAVANNDPQQSGVTNAEAKKQAEAVEKWETSKQHAADLVKQRETDLEDAKAKYKENSTGASRADIQTAPTWWSAAKYAVGLGPGGAEVAKAKTEDSNELYRKALQAISELKRARDTAAKLDGESPHTIERGLWGMLGLKTSIGGTAQLGYAMSQIAMQPTIDKATGGYALRGLAGPGDLAVDGGIKYKPIAGAAGFSDRKLTRPGELDPNFKADLNQQIAVLLMQAFNSGFPVVGKD